MKKSRLDILLDNHEICSLAFHLRTLLEKRNVDIEPKTERELVTLSNTILSIWYESHPEISMPLIKPSPPRRTPNTNIVSPEPQDTIGALSLHLD